MSEGAFPLCWPEGWPRTPERQRLAHLSGWEHINSQSWTSVTHRLLEQLRLFGARAIILSTNQPVRRDGLPYAQKRLIDDPGVAVYFEIDKRRLVLAQDSYWWIMCNMRSVSLAIEGMRQMRRHGGQHMMERAFTGFLALPPPAQTQARPWHEVFDLPEHAPIDAIVAKYRHLASALHPDSGGSNEAMAELNLAYEQAKGAKA